ncbi:hypothetical protein Rhal01_03547 [Rubritalea halochordaticola]|uniref:Diphthamide synthase domain-containing protein n=1 Tax=Rubritalea halochordaticola TaxID=714537 RepID=A0ABP9V4A6_9BACT
MSTAWMHWSGGKDSAFALAKVLEAAPGSVAGLVTSMSEEFRRVSMHGVREELLDAQAERLGLPLQKLLIPKDASMAAYGEMMQREMAALRELGAETCIFGDIFLEDLKAYREKEMEGCQLKCEFPIWKLTDTQELARQIIESGVKAKIVCVSGKYFDRSFLGRDYDIDFLNALPEGVDPCGENGEFHSFVYDSPLYHSPIEIREGEVSDRSYTPGEGDEDCDCCKTWDTEFYFQDLQLVR